MDHCVCRMYVAAWLKSTVRVYQRPQPMDAVDMLWIVHMVSWPGTRATKPAPPACEGRWVPEDKKGRKTSKLSAPQAPWDGHALGR